MRVFAVLFLLSVGFSLRAADGLPQKKLCDWLAGRGVIASPVQKVVKAYLVAPSRTGTRWVEVVGSCDESSEDLRLRGVFASSGTEGDTFFITGAEFDLPLIESGVARATASYRRVISDIGSGSSQQVLKSHISFRRLTLNCSENDCAIRLLAEVEQDETLVNMGQSVTRKITWETEGGFDYLTNPEPEIHQVVEKGKPYIFGKDFALLKTIN